jgi:hypothetical protein
MPNQIQAAITATVIALIIVACQKAEPPPEVREDIAQAQIQAEVDSAVTTAEGEHRIALERCDVLIGEERDLCVDEADQALEAARNEAQGMPPAAPTPPTQ